MSSLLEKAEIERNLPEKEKAIIFRAYEEEMYGEGNVWELYLDSVVLVEEHQVCHVGQHHSVYTINIREYIADYRDQRTVKKSRGPYCSRDVSPWH